MSVPVHIPDAAVAVLRGCLVGGAVVATAPGITLSESSKRERYGMTQKKLQIPKRDRKREVFAVLDDPHSGIVTFKPAASYCNDSRTYRTCLPCAGCPKPQLPGAAGAAGRTVAGTCAVAVVVLTGVRCAVARLCAAGCVCAVRSVHLGLLRGNSLVYSCLCCWERGLIAIRGSRYSFYSTSAGHPRRHYLAKPPADELILLC